MDRQEEAERENQGLKGQCCGIKSELHSEISYIEIAYKESNPSYRKDVELFKYSGALDCPPGLGSLIFLLLMHHENS